DNYFARYLPLLIHFVLASLLAGAIVVLSWVIGYRKPTRAKLSPYECGMTPVGDARERFSVKFYLLAMLFILFDVETVFLYPWAVILRDLKMFGFGRCWSISELCWSDFFISGKKECWTGARHRPGEVRFDAVAARDHRPGAAQ